MVNRHVTHLLTRYAHGQLRPRQRARVLNHVRTCGACRAALAREDRLAGDLRREMPSFGQPTSTQLARVWEEVWDEIDPTQRSRPRRSYGGLAWLPGLSMMVALVLVLAVALPLLAQSGIRAEAAPHQPRPVDLSSPTPGATRTNEALMVSVPRDSGKAALPQATVAYAYGVGASPAPMPIATVSPVAP